MRGSHSTRRSGLRSLLRVGAGDPRPSGGSHGATLLYMHIPKTAGTSMRKLLGEHFPADQQAFLYDDEPGWMSVDDFRNLRAEQKRKIRLVMGHFFYGLHESLPQPARYVTMLRDPVARVVSDYEHVRRIPTHVRHRRVRDGDLSLYDYVQIGKRATNNFMVRQLSGDLAVPFGGCTRAHLDLALRHMESHFSAVLLMEYMEESLVRLGEVLGTHLGPLSRDNANPHEQDLGSLDPAVVAKIEELNHLDRELYERVRGEGYG